MKTSGLLGSSIFPGRTEVSKIYTCFTGSRNLNRDWMTIGSNSYVRLSNGEVKISLSNGTWK